MMNFEFTSRPTQVIFGANRFDDLLAALSDYQRVMIFASTRMQPYASRVAEQYETHVFTEIIQHVPQSLVDEALTRCKTFNPDVLLAIGGGSAIGLAKAVALSTNLPIAAVPSTFSGSEQTTIWGISDEDGKTTGKDDKVLPRLVLYDSDFTVSMPRELAVKSTMNAMAHLVEAVYAPDGNPLTRELALKGMRDLHEGLQLLLSAGDEGQATDSNHTKRTDSESTDASKVKASDDGIMERPMEGSRLQRAHERLLLGAYLAGKCLGEVSMSLHHKTAHVLGGSFGLDHASVHTVLQSYVLDYQWPYLREELRSDFVTALGEHPSKTLREMAQSGGVPISLASIGFKQKDIPKAVSIILSKPYANVAPLEESRLIKMLHRAYSGEE